MSVVSGTHRQLVPGVVTLVVRLYCQLRMSVYGEVEKGCSSAFIMKRIRNHLHQHLALLFSVSAVSSE